MLEVLFHCFMDSLRPEKVFCGYHLLAVDGSSMKSAVYGHDRCMEGLKAFALENERRIQDGVTEVEPFHVLLFSEWGMFCSISEKRAREEAIVFCASLIIVSAVKKK